MPLGRKKIVLADGSHFGTTACNVNRFQKNVRLLERTLRERGRTAAAIARMLDMDPRLLERWDHCSTLPDDLLALCGNPRTGARLAPLTEEAAHALSRIGGGHYASSLHTIYRFVYAEAQVEFIRHNSLSLFSYFSLRRGWQIGAEQLEFARKHEKRLAQVGTWTAQDFLDWTEFQAKLLAPPEVEQAKPYKRPDYPRRQTMPSFGGSIEEELARTPVIQGRHFQQNRRPR